MEPAGANGGKRVFPPRGARLACSGAAVAVLVSWGLARADAAPVQSGRTVGPPQVLEIPTAPAPEPASPPGPEQGSAGDLALSGLDPQDPQAGAVVAAQERNTGFLGVLYGTAEEGQTGVWVLGVVEGSPAQRAGFVGPLREPTWGDKAMRVAIPLLVLSPAAPLAIPLAIVHNVYTSGNDTGDRIVKVAGEDVRDARDFSTIMNRFGPGDTVLFDVLRRKKVVQLSATLVDEPS